MVSFQLQVVLVARLLSHLAGEEISKNICDSPTRAEGVQSRMLIEWAKVCYVWIADGYKLTREERGGTSSFSLSQARTICKRYHATVLTIHDELENFTVSLEKLPAPLGVEVEIASGHIFTTWDDGVKSNFRPVGDRWHGKENGGSTFTTPTGPWQTFKPGGAPSNYSLVCKQNLTVNFPPTTRALTTTVPTAGVASKSKSCGLIIAVVLRAVDVVL